ncbi:GNAT family N-acetyltransferase [Candidatus Formimonas warabiya]|uniref:Uncharacterized protein n=1 Tax=Formimonas warabiya TaxID=1761012 RepID=A0A3G1KX92_FORW1|nr:GNAT family N-acetyltransferase [Candidatus Formimonas warabiya]ATW26825.1 hypothetical protein DCMF_20510 [Candidatus Formimonas warabiya]
MNGLVIDPALTLADHEQMAKYKENYFTPELIIPPEITYTWYLSNPQAFIAARDMQTGQIVGHLNYFPFRNEMLTEFFSGKLDGSVFSVSYLKQNPNIIRRYDSPGEYYLYLSSVAVAPQYSHTNLFRMLVNAYGEVLLQLAKREMYISFLVANAVTRQGIKLGNYFHMRSGIISVPQYDIYISTALTDFLKCMKKSLRTELSAAYKNFTSGYDQKMLIQD